ncbi:hypothetical protein EK21DRAFT_93912 [Setomelanomma holmii]|uniref:Uncharacterized protein n=1 Tax=Setomelanomma holmii TaxID=210430 RepID=A0A9P4GXB2_9PLEO|nr:hypothetical protein EK21DRAFT_93912 [Setomelanomma holmii]
MNDSNYHRPTQLQSFLSEHDTMERVTARAASTVLLSSFAAPQSSIAVTERFSRQHQVSSRHTPHLSILTLTHGKKLVSLAYRRFGNDYPLNAWDVHSHYDCAHVMNGRCLAELDDFLYDEDEYFSGTYTKDGWLHLFAHFVAKRPEEVQQQEQPSGKLPMLHHEDLNDRIGSTVRTAFKLEFSPSPPQHRRVQQNHDNSSDSRQEPTKVKHMPRVITTTELTELRATPHESSSGASAYPALPMGATAAQFKKDRESMMLSGPPRRSKHYRPDYQLRAKSRKGAVAHVLLMNGEFYGVEAKQPCTNCVRRGVTCRICHPDIQRLCSKTGVRIGAYCVRCRADATGGCCAA